MRGRLDAKEERHIDTGSRDVGDGVQRSTGCRKPLANNVVDNPENPFGRCIHPFERGVCRPTFEFYFCVITTAQWYAELRTRRSRADYSPESSRVDSISAQHSLSPFISSHPPSTTSLLDVWCGALATAKEVAAAEARAVPACSFGGLRRYYLARSLFVAMWLGL
jgi:hypothetical protein